MCGSNNPNLMHPPTFLIKSKLIVSAVFLWRFIFSDNKCMRGLMSLEYNIAMRSYPIILRDLHNDFPMYCWECDEICQILKINTILVSSSHSLNMNRLKCWKFCSVKHWQNSRHDLLRILMQRKYCYSMWVGSHMMKWNYLPS